MGDRRGRGAATQRTATEIARRDGEPAGTAAVLSPAAIRNKMFTVVRLREGYDPAEVDGFLSLVEMSLTKLLRENEELRGRAAAAPDEEACAARLDALERDIESVHAFVACFGERMKETIDGHLDRLHSLLDELRDRAWAAFGPAARRTADPAGPADPTPAEDRRDADIIPFTDDHGADADEADGDGALSGAWDAPAARRTPG